MCVCSVCGSHVEEAPGSRVSLQDDVIPLCPLQEVAHLQACRTCPQHAVVMATGGVVAVILVSMETVGQSCEEDHQMEETAGHDTWSDTFIHNLEILQLEIVQLEIVQLEILQLEILQLEILQEGDPTGPTGRRSYRKEIQMGD